MAASAGMYVRGSHAFVRNFSSSCKLVALHHVTKNAPAVGRAEVRWNRAPTSRDPQPLDSPERNKKNRCKTQLIPPALGSRRACNRCLTICALWCQPTASWQPHCQRHGGRPGLRNADQARTAILQRAKKQLFGLEFDHYFRFAVAHFGIKTSGNAFHALLSEVN